MNIYVDIDGTICDGDFPYNNCTPMKERIAKINSLYDSGDNITWWTFWSRLHSNN